MPPKLISVSVPAFRRSSRHRVQGTRSATRLDLPASGAVIQGRAYGDLTPFLFWFFSALMALCVVVGAFGVWMAANGYVPAEQTLSQSTVAAAEAATEADAISAATEAGPESASPILTALFTEDQAAAGAEIYAARCAMCHGAEPADGTAAPPLAGPEFHQNWQGQPVGALYAFTHDNMPLDDPGSLTDEEYASVVAYILAANGFEAGETALPASSNTEAVLDFAAAAGEGVPPVEDAGQGGAEEPTPADEDANAEENAGQGATSETPAD
jgi:mono/diheme cytochrome c family protein